MAISLVILLVSSLSYQAGQAQSSDQSAGENWSQPLNLSQSGASTQPRLVIDSSGKTDLLWVDQFNGLMAIQGQGEKWSEPASLDLADNIMASSLKLAASPDGRILAAWLTDVQSATDRSALYFAQALNDDFTLGARWGIDQLAVGIGGFDLAVSDTGAVHLVYLRNEPGPNTPAGIYALRYVNGSISASSLLMASSYYRGLTAAQFQISLTVSGNKIYAAWDDPRQERVYQASSPDNGETWGQAQEVDRRQAGDGNGAGPSRPVIGAQGDQVLLTWQAGHQGNNCGQMFQVSNDGGQKWSSAAYLPAPLNQSCARRLQFLANAAGTTYLMAETTAGIQLMAWQPVSKEQLAADPASGWSPAVLQSVLNGFTNPATFRTVSLVSQQAALTGNRLTVAGADNSGTGDIWLLERTLGEPKTWFPAAAPEPLWSSPAALDSSARLVRPAVLVAEANRLHALWTIEGDENIYYALWDGERWTASQAVLASPSQAPGDLTAALLPGGLLSVAWNDLNAGKLYYSLAPLTQALNPDRWLAPQELPGGQAAIAPQALALADGRLAIAFAVPYNEQRGLYLLVSKVKPEFAQVQEWEDRLTVFDAAAAGWESLSNPRLAQDNAGGLHILWRRDNLPPNPLPDGIFSASSACREPSGTCLEWSAPELVQGGAILWSQLLAAPGQLHRAWQELVGGQAVFFHQVSLDQGLTWSKAGRLSEAAGTASPAPSTLVLDGAGRLTLLRLAAPERTISAASAASLAPLLQRWTWQDGAWQKLEEQSLAGLEQALALSAAAPASGLAAIYSGQAAPAPSSALADSQPTPAPQYGLYVTHRKLEGGASGEAGGASGEAGAPAAQTTPEPGGAANETIVGAGTPTPTLPEPTATFSLEPATDEFGNSFGGKSGVLMLGAIPAVLFVLVLFFILARRLMFPGR